MQRFAPRETRESGGGVRSIFYLPPTVLWSPAPNCNSITTVSPQYCPSVPRHKMYQTTIHLSPHRRPRSTRPAARAPLCLINQVAWKMDSNSRPRRYIPVTAAPSRPPARRRRVPILFIRNDCWSTLVITLYPESPPGFALPNSSRRSKIIPVELAFYRCRRSV